MLRARIAGPVLDSMCDAMIVRCGKCQTELEVAGAGEFVCPACGTRNMVRGGGAPPSPFDVSGLGSSPLPNIPPPAPVDVSWVKCETCAYRFAVGEVAEVACPMCGTTVRLTDEGKLPSE
jgi:predicted RNA-binding Zn-ribbon protein involved in translation (DUF1610 family)